VVPAGEVQQVHEHLGPHRRQVEVVGGGVAVALGLEVPADAAFDGGVEQRPVGG
jgi:hypothetical protein